jgi:hypothetical protein
VGFWGAGEGWHCVRVEKENIFLERGCSSGKEHRGLPTEPLDFLLRH